VITGLGVTAIIQSSSTVTAMLVGFVNAGLLQVTQTVGVVMGANIGTTVTAFIVSLDIGEIAPVLIIAGVLVIFFAKNNTVKYTAQIVVGVGILFYGMEGMKESLEPFTENLQPLFEQTKNPFLGILLGFAVTAIFQCSSAVTGVLVVLAGTLSPEGIPAIDLSSAIFIIYGSNIGACTTSLLASIGAIKKARKVSVVCFAFNIIGTIIFTIITVLPLGYINLLETLLPNPKMQIAVAHLVFNTVTAIVLFPVAGILEKIADFVIRIKDPDSEEKNGQTLEHLDHRLLNPPSIAVEASYREIARMAKLALKNYRLSMDMFLNRNLKNTQRIKDNEATINFLNHEITGFLVKISSLDLDVGERNTVGSFYHVVNDIERVGDHAENIMEFSADFIKNPNLFSETAIGELKKVSDDIENVLSSAIDMFEKRVYNHDELERILNKEEGVDESVKIYKRNHVDRLNKQICTPTSGVIFINMLTDLERVSDHAANIALSLRFKNHNDELLINAEPANANA
jgi:phosphate:Na+ symporter